MDPITRMYWVGSLFTVFFCFCFFPVHQPTPSLADREPASPQLRSHLIAVLFPPVLRLSRFYFDLFHFVFSLPCMPSSRIFRCNSYNAPPGMYEVSATYVHTYADFGFVVSLLIGPKVV